MNANHDLERRIADFYAREAPGRAPDRVLGAALSTIDNTSQRRVPFGLPWRFKDMNSYAKLAVAAVVAIAVGAIGLTVLWPGQGPSVGGLNPSSSPSLLPSPSPALTARFTSTLHDVSISYPANWTAVAATETAPTGEAGFLDPTADWLYDPELQDHLFIVISSESREGRVGFGWANDVLNDPARGCGADGGFRMTITVDGEPGMVCGTLALTWRGDRGYSILLYVSGDDPEVGEIYSYEWFESVLATVDLPSS